MVTAVAERTETATSEPLPHREPTYNENVLATGEMLFREDGFVISVQLAGVLLMVAMVGAIVLAKKSLPRPPRDEDVLPPGEIGRRAEPF